MKRVLFEVLRGAISAGHGRVDSNLPQRAESYPYEQRTEGDIIGPVALWGGPTMLVWTRPKTHGTDDVKGLVNTNNRGVKNRHSLLR